MKILILGDIHGRLIWYDIIKHESPDTTIFLGDYITSHEGIYSEQQLANLEDILNYKENNPDKVILLRGNHDIQHLGYSWAECSGYDKKLHDFMSSSYNKNRFLDNTQWIYIDNKTIFSHAGISQVWMNNSKIESVYDINKLEPSELFGFTPDHYFDIYGTSKTQPPTWIRPKTLCTCNIKGWDQVVGHTPVKNIINIYESSKYNQNIWLCDNLYEKQYLTIDNGEFIINNLNL